ncbi:alpha/beta hydrolase [Nonomuraea sp. NPDC049714]|uniref:alpha/beta hydrolase n=1 Tax=Nonomuraea sp. NPDC049714 TaxID=3364357 RepID=UPI00379D2766
MRTRRGVLGVLALATLVLAAAPAPPDRRLVKVFGDPATADRVAIIVPGADVTAETFDTGTHRPGGSARALLAEAARLASDRRLAVVAWLGYDSPPSVSVDVVLDTSAAEGAAALRETVSALRERTMAPIALLCHSYGSVVCAKALPGLPVSDLAVFGSPGLEAPSATALTRRLPPTTPTLTSTSAAPPPLRHGAGPGPLQHWTGPGPLARWTGPGPLRHWAGPGAPPVRLWAGRGGDDWIRFVPKMKFGSLGFGTDPMDPGFGARIFEVGPGGHSDYFEPGTPSLRNLTLIALGRPDEVTRAPGGGV